MKSKMTILILIVSLLTCIVTAQDRPLQGTQNRPGPPPQAYEDCKGKKAGDTVQHMTREGKVNATCMDSPQGLVARPNRQSGAQPDVRQPQTTPPQGQQFRSRANPYSIEQAVSDHAQLHTIAFSGLAFVTGDFGTATFIPPGKVCDFFGFQYMRDIDAAGKGHNPMFLNRVAGNVLHILNDGQRTMLEKAARQEAEQLRVLAGMRLPLIKAFYREFNGDIPRGSKGLNKDAVIQYVGKIFAFDGELSYRRAQIFGQLAASFTPEQKGRLAKMKFGDFNTWPAIDVDGYKLPRGTEKIVNVAYMTYASEFFSWYAGSVSADTYFCPERHGTYFGGFYMKDMPAMGKRDYDISTSVTGDSGKAFLAALTETQRKYITNLVGLQRQDLKEIVKTRRAIATELRHFLKGKSADRAKVLALSKRYGELDGKISYLYAMAFAEVGKTLTVQQRNELARLRTTNPSDPQRPFLYSSPISMPKIENTDFLFGVI
ncbi:MAG: hypothetical protein CSYNP_02281 [Syntrophus sp. SKADARSKE-3]|nr:hypothetical protein [Syntrophus sp. SKADARSKE-3]